MQCANHPDTPATGICTRCDSMLCAQCVQDRSGRTFCQNCAQFLDQRSAHRPHPGGPPPPPPAAADPYQAPPPPADPYQAPPPPADPYQAPPPGGVYQGPAPGGDVYQGPAPGGDVYQGPAPGGDVYQGPAPGGDVYQGPAGDQGDVYQGDVYQGDMYQGDVYQGQAAGAQAPPAPSMSIGHFLFSFKGRISVGAYWLKYQIPYWVLYGLMLYLDTGGFDLESLESPGSATLGFVLLAAFPTLAINVKRLHDRGRSGWFLLIGAIPFIGGIWLFIELSLLGGTPGTNQYGEEP